MNVLEPIARRAVTRPDSVALCDGARQITYRELAGLTARTAAHLGAIGAAPGERVGLCLKDTIDHVVALLAIARLGAVAVPLDWRARSAENLRLIDAAGLAHLLVEPDTVPPPARHIVALDAAWHRAVARAEPKAAVPSEWCKPFLIAASSGSTGAPKLTVMTHLQYHFAVTGMLELMGLAGHHRYLSTLPLYYSGGRNSCLAHLLRGDRVILYPSLFGPDEYIDAARRHRATTGVVTPSVLRDLMGIRDADPLLPGMLALFCAGAPLFAEEKREAWRRVTPNFHERYGTAETLAIAVLRPCDIAERAESVGQPHSMVEVEIVDTDDRPLPERAVGRVRCRGPGLASALPGQETIAGFRGGWFHPGEIGSLDELGYLFLRGRTAEVIIRRGTKIHPAEVERVLLDHPDVVEAAVIGRRTADHEEEVIAFIASPRDPAIGELLAHCRSLLTAHKVPRQIQVLRALPKNPSGKVDKMALAREQANRPAAAENT
jgi:acyl-coenzyme A synthetase/AMP-(fatty) acid ligase